MRFNILVKLTGLLSLASVAICQQMTYYGENGTRPSTSYPPSCGIKGVNLSTDYYVALNAPQYDPTIVDNNPNKATVCNKCVKIHRNNKWVVGIIIDKCPGCSKYDLDVSPTIFKTLEDLGQGRVTISWEYTDCSLLGKSGTGSSSSPQEEPKKTTTRITTTVKRTTTKERVTVKPTTIAKPTPQVVPVSQKPVPTTTKASVTSVDVSKNTPVVVPVNSAPVVPSVAAPVATPVATPVTASVNDAPVDAPVVVPVNPVDSTSRDTPVNSAPVAPNKQTPVSTTKTTPANNNVIKDNNEKEGGSNLVVPLTGAFIITGAAGLGLLYYNRDSNSVNNLKEKFPEAFNNIKRSISRGSTHLRRSLSNSGLALKRSLSKKDQYESSGLNIRTKKEYRASLDAHYPVQLSDTPMNELYQNVTSNGYSQIEDSEPNYNLKHFDSSNGDNDMKIDFHDSN